MKYFNMLDIKLSQIQIFLAAAQRESITKAAQYLHLSQSMVSKNIKYLEDTLGLYLFIRDKQHLRLTPAGRHLMEEFSDILALSQKALEKAHTIQAGASLPVTVGLPDSSNLERIFLDTKNLLQKEKKFTNFHTECLPFQDLNRQLLKGELDIVITCGFELPSYQQEAFVCHSLPAGTYYAYMRPEHPLSSRDSVSVQELRPYSFLMVSPKDTPMYEQLVVQMCSKAGFSPLVSKYVSSPNAFICNFDTGMEIFIADTYMRDSENQQLVRVPIQDMDSTMGFIYRKSNENLLVPYVCRQIMEAWEITK